MRVLQKNKKPFFGTIKKKKRHLFLVRTAAVDQLQCHLCWRVQVLWHNVSLVNLQLVRCRCAERERSKRRRHGEAPPPRAAAAQRAQQRAQNRE